MAILASALTTAARVKTRIGTSESTWDALLAELINAATEFIEGELGRNLKSATYTNQLYDIEAGQRRCLFCANGRVATVSSINIAPEHINAPSWTTLQTDDWEIVGDGRQARSGSIFHSKTRTRSASLTLQDMGLTFNPAESHAAL